MNGKQEKKYLNPVQTASVMIMLIEEGYECGDNNMTINHRLGAKRKCRKCKQTFKPFKISTGVSHLCKRCQRLEEID